MAAGETNLATDVDLDVCSERPEVLAVPRSGHLTVVAGEAAELRCEVTRGSPRPDITWKREVRREGGREGGRGREGDGVREDFCLVEGSIDSFLSI